MCSTFCAGVKYMHVIRYIIITVYVEYLTRLSISVNRF